MCNPSDELKKKLAETGMSRKELAVRTGVTEKHICTILNGDRSISTAYARKLGYVFPKPKDWIQLVVNYEAEQLRIKEENEITSEEISILKPLHEINQYFIQQGYIENDCGDASKVMALRGFLRVSNLTQITSIPSPAVYRAQLTKNTAVNPYVLFAWQRLCEEETLKVMPKVKLNKKLLLKKIPEIKAQMFGAINSGISKLTEMLSECGIAFKVVKNFRGAPVQGFVKKTEEEKLILCLTIRGKRADSFWFTLFHEIGHVINEDYKLKFVDFNSFNGDAEGRADEFAKNTLISPKLYSKFITEQDCTSWNGIEKFAKESGVQPFIVLGRLQKDEILDWSDYPDKVVRYSWA